MIYRDNMVDRDKPHGTCTKCPRVLVVRYQTDGRMPRHKNPQGEPCLGGGQEAAETYQPGGRLYEKPRRAER